MTGRQQDHSSIRSLFSNQRPIDRPIEKVIDYYATDDRRLQAEVEEYEVTDNVEENFRRFLDIYDAGVSGHEVTEVGIWVSGFYGSGKSSFTKYLGFALDPSRRVAGYPFVDLLVDRILALDVRQHLRTVAQRYPTTVIMLDLGSEQLATSASAPVSSVLYAKVLQWAGYSREEKLAELEMRLERDGLLADFRAAYTAEYPDEWEAVHNDPLIGIPRADKLVPRFYPQEFPEPGTFRNLRFSSAADLREQVRKMLTLIRRRSGRRNVLFLIDEAGQYVAPNQSLILNLDGLARNIKELGQGHAWIVATGQQRLTEIVERAALNSTELNRLRDRFPISIELDARDISEITYRRLLTKSHHGESQLRQLFQRHGQSLITNTRLSNTRLFTGDPDQEAFVRYYPLLPQHFQILMELIRVLARARGGLGLRSAIRVVQDLLVDVSRALPPGHVVLADQPVGTLASADIFYDTLRADINKTHPQVVLSVDRVEQLMPGDALALRVAKAIGATQPIDTFPRTAENIAALLYQNVGDPPNIVAVREALNRLLAVKEIGLVDDPQSGGFSFLSEGVRPLRERRNEYVPSQAEFNRLRSEILKSLFEPLPQVSLQGSKTVRAGLMWGQTPIAGEDNEIRFRIEVAERNSWDRRRTDLLAETTGAAEWKTTVAWLIRPDETIDDTLVEVLRSQKVVRDVSDSDTDRDIAQFVRSERRSIEANQERARDVFRRALMEGTLIFQGRATPALNAGPDLVSAAKEVLQQAAVAVYPLFSLAPIRASTDLAARFLAVERLDRMPAEADPLHLVVRSGGQPRVDTSHRALSAVLDKLRERFETAGTPRLQGNMLQDLFAAAPYGWSKDTTRYLFAGLLLAGEIALHTSAGEITVRGQSAIEALKTTQAFNRTGVSFRGSKPDLDTLLRAAERLQQVLGEPIMPLEDSISAATRENLPEHFEGLDALAATLRLLGVAGAERAQDLTDTGRTILQGDGSGAVSILGAVDSSFPDDLRWAKRVQQALEQGVTDDIRAARAILTQAEAVQRLVPSIHLVTQADRDLLDDVLGSDAFFDRVGQLRELVRRIRDRTADLYQASFAEYQAGLTAIRNAMENEPVWLRLGEDDREDIAEQLLPVVQPVVSADQALAYIGPLLMAKAGLGTLKDRMLDELRVRDPGVLVENSGQPVEISIGELLPAAELVSANDLDLWLETVRERISGALQQGIPVRIVVSTLEGARR